MEITTLDLETEAIGPRPEHYPPKPVGLAIRHPDGVCEYLSFGHPSDNNCTEEEAKRAWLKACQGPVLFHSATFDIEVAIKWWGVDWPRHWHDSLYALYLQDLHAQTYSLKPSAERILNIKPEEQDAVRDWILANVPGSTKKNFGAFISLAPVALVAPYAIGDVQRTYRLFENLYSSIAQHQPEAYMREIRLAPHLIHAERRGIRVDRGLLTTWHEAFEPAIERCDMLISNRLGTENLNIDSNDDLVAALDRAKVMNAWQLTDGSIIPVDDNGQALPVSPFAVAEAVAEVTPGKRSVSKSALRRFCKDRELVDLILYRNVAATMLRTFIDPWEELSRTDGRLHTRWHAVRGVEKNGTRTGRIASAEPNLANVVNANDAIPPLGCPFLPSLRAALLPEKGHVWVSADYSQQELRWAAHFEDHLMLKAYRENPYLDLHQHAADMIHKFLGMSVSRKQTKTVAFATIYGAGISELARQLDCSEDDAALVKDAYFKVVPGLLQLAGQVKAKARQLGYVRSGGGRVIKVEPPKMVKGRMRSFEYKLLNHLIQGTAADQTKEAIIDFCMHGTSGLLTTTVYDEINISVPRDDLGPVTNVLSDCMIDALPCDVQHIVTTEVGKSWGSLVDVTPGSSVKHILEKVDAQ